MNSTDRLTVRAVVFTLAIVVVGGMAAMVALTLLDKTIPDQVDRVVSVALGAIAGLLARTSSHAEGEPVPVINFPGGEPLAVEEVAPN